MKMGGIKATLLILICGLCQHGVLSGNWQTNLRPKLFLEMSERDFASFLGPAREDGGPGSSGNSSSSSASSLGELYSPRNDFSVILPVEDGHYLMVGAQNALYKLELRDSLRLRQKLEWNPSAEDVEKCTVKGNSKRECQNYLMVLEQYPQDRDNYLLCGTNAFRPYCKVFVDERGAYIEQEGRGQSGLGMCPFFPDHNSTAVLVGTTLFAGTVADPSGVDPIIFRKSPQTRTRQYDATQLNSPDFVGSLSEGDYVYFFFRENAVEYINCGKAIFSRVARVCKDDTGGPGKHWTSFLKTRLNCSVPGDFPFYFDEIQGVTPLIKGSYAQQDDHIIYATFTTPDNSIGGSAVCAFRLREISDAFSGKFKEQRDTGANWLPVPDSKVPNPRPGTCMNDTSVFTDFHINFIRSHSLMDETVAPFFGAPVLVRTGLQSKFTTLVVDPQITTTDGKKYDIIFTGTTNGRVLKSINSLSADSRTAVKTVIIEELQVFERDVIIKSLKVVGSEHDGGRSLGKLVVMSTNEIRSFPVQRCDRASTCQECVALQDPYCAWDVRSARCGSGDWTPKMASSFIQSVSTGIHLHCPISPPIGGDLDFIESSKSSAQSWNEIQPVGLVINIIQGKDNNQNNQNDLSVSTSNTPGVPVVEPSAVLFSLETLVITVSAGAVAALVVGFVIGYCCGRKCGKESNVHLPYPDTEYEYFEQRQGLARPMAPLLPTSTDKVDPRDQEEVTYAEPELITRPLPAPALNALNTMGGKYYDSDRFGSSGGGGSHYSSSILQANKFNTIHNVNKRNKGLGGGGIGLGGAGDIGTDRGLLDSGRVRGGAGGSGGQFINDAQSHYRNRDYNNGGPSVNFHMSTLGRSSIRNSGKGNSSSPADGNGEGTQQVVDSAYGTTRSVKKVYL